MRKAQVIYQDDVAGVLTEEPHGYAFQYDSEYLANNGEPVSLTLPIQVSPHRSLNLFPFFDGLIPEGWILDIVEKNWKVNPRDRMGILLVACSDCIGAVSIKPLS